MFLFKFCISDNGIGLDTNVVEKEAIKKKSLGLFSIRERIAFLKGKMIIDSKLGEGTNVTITIPIEAIVN